MLACKGISATRIIDTVNYICGLAGFFEEYVPVFCANSEGSGMLACTFDEHRDIELLATR